MGAGDYRTDTKHQPVHMEADPPDSAVPQRQLPQQAPFRHRTTSQSQTAGPGQQQAQVGSQLGSNNNLVAVSDLTQVPQCSALRVVEIN